MIEVQVDADVTESRQVTITLPPEVPVGRVWLAVGVTPVLRALKAEPGPDGYYRSGLVTTDELPVSPE